MAQEKIPTNLLDRIANELDNNLAAITKTQKKELKQLAERIATVQAERVKWAEQTMDGLIPIDVAHQKQDELTRQLNTLRTAREQQQTVLPPRKPARPSFYRPFATCRTSMPWPRTTNAASSTKAASTASLSTTSMGISPSRKPKPGVANLSTLFID
jgi:hypothetical protein